MPNELEQHLNPAAGSQPPPDILIRASAGTGKTFQLSNRFLFQLSRGVVLEQILATTFTRKAAGEILERILIRLAKAALSESELQSLSTFLEYPLTREHCLNLLADLTRSLHRLRIGTLDSFFAQVASCFSLDLGLPPGWRIIDDLTDAELRTRAIDELLRDDATADIVRMMTLITAGDAERSVSEHLKQTISDLYQIFLETDESAWQTITRSKQKSAEELTVAIEQLRTLEMTSGKRFETARQSDLVNVENEDWETFIGKGLAGKIVAGVESFYKKPITAEIEEAYKPLIDQATAALLNPIVDQVEATYQMLQRFDAIYHRLKHEARALRFEDVPRQLSRQSEISASERFDFRMDGGISHLLLDEFQDTSYTQWNVLLPFARRVTQTGGDSSFFCVGDVKQAIYGWRGGSAAIFDTLQTQLDGVEVQSLDSSFRSSVPVIDTVNQIFQNLTSHPNLKDSQAAALKWQNEFRQHETARQELPGYTTLVTTPQADEGESKDKVTQKFAAELVRDLLQKAPEKNIGILARKNDTVAQMVFELRRLGVPASEEGGSPLYDSPAVEAILSLLRMADCPGDTVARFHVANSPLATVVDFSDYNNGHRALVVSQQVRAQLVHRGYGPVIYGWVQKLIDSCSKRDLSRLKQLVELAYDFQPLVTLRPSDFVRQVELQKVHDPTSDQVRVMTVHQAKGLQFDSVVVIDLDRNLVRSDGKPVVSYCSETQKPERVCLYRKQEIRSLFPKSLQKMFSDARDRRVAEALCVLYVALTRAEHAMYMVVAPSAKSEKNLPSTGAGLLRASLTTGELAAPEETLFEIGDPKWYLKAGQSTEQTVELSEPATDQAEKPKSVTLAPMPDGRLRGLVRQAPSSHGKKPTSLLGEKLAPQNQSALNRGTLIHGWFEQVEWLGEQWPDQEQLFDNATRQGFVEEDIDRYLAQFRDMLRKPTIERVLSRAHYFDMHPELEEQNPQLFALATQLSSSSSPEKMRIQVENEYHVEARIEGAFVEGRIDRLVLFFDGESLVGADLIDFKTDSLGPKQELLDKKVATYREQLNVYRNALAQNLRIDENQISARLLFVGADVVYSV